MINDLTRTQQEALTDVFTYHAPTSEQIANLQSLREAAKHFAEVILITCPASWDRTMAFYRVREALHLANASIMVPSESIVKTLIPWPEQEDVAFEDE